MARITMLFIMLFFMCSFAFAANITATLDSANGSSSFAFNDSGATQVGAIDSDGNMILKGGLRLDAGGVECTTSEMLIIDGYIGIGTDNPSHKLELYHDSRASIRILSGNTGAPSYRSCIELESDIDFRGRGIFYKCGDDDEWFSGITYGGNFYAIGRHASLGEYRDYAKLQIAEDGRTSIGYTQSVELLTLGGNLALQEQGAAPGNTANFGKFYVKSADSLPYFMDDSGTEFGLTGGEYPEACTIWGEECTVTVGNSLLFEHNTNQNYACYVYQNPSANGDTFEKDFFLEAGNYNFSVLGFPAANRGKIDWYIDNVLKVSGQDWYAGGNTYNAIKTAAVTISGDGKHTLKGVVNGTTGGNYYIVWTKAWFVKQ